MTRGPAHGKAKRMSKNSVRGCPTSGAGSGKGIQLPMLFRPQAADYLHTSQPPWHSLCPCARPQCCKFPGQRLIFPDFWGFSQLCFSGRPFRFAKDPISPACFPLAKRLALIHLHKHRAPYTHRPVIRGLCLAGKGLPLQNLPCALSVVSCCLEVPQFPHL